MRVNASLKSIINGVTTLKDQMSTPGFAKEQVNFRGDPIQGLTRRPPFEHVTAMGTTESTDIVIDITVDGEKYWVVIKPSEIGVDDNNSVVIYDIAGNSASVSVDSTAIAYLSSLSGEEDLAYTTIGDVTFLVNKNTTVLEDDELSSGNTTSMLHCKSSVNISDAPTTKFQFYDGVGGSIVTIDYTFTGSGQLSTTKMAKQLTTEINANATNVTATRLKSAIMLDLDSGTNEYVDLVMIDDVNGSIVGMNGFIADIADLPASVNDNEVMEVRPLTTTGDTVDGTSYYLRAETISPLSPADPNVKVTDTELRSESDLGSLNRETRGVSDITLDMSAASLPNVPNTFGGTVTGSLTHNAITYDLQAIMQFLSKTSSAPNNEWKGTVAVYFEKHSEQVFNNIALRDVATGDLLLNMAVDNFIEGPTEATNSSVYYANRYYLGEDTDFISKMIAGKDYTLEFNPPADFSGSKYTKWTETCRLDEKYKLDASTMPIALIKAGSDFIVQQPLTAEGDIAWGERTAGDSVSAPFPSFVNNTITDVERIQERLSLVSKDNWIASRTNNIFSFWRTTALSTVAIDYVDISSTASGNVPFTSMTAHNRDILLFSDHGQFKIDGTQPIDPRSIAIPRVSTYEHQPTSKPISTGVDVYFGTTYGSSAGLARFMVDSQRETIDVAHSVTDHVLGYIPGAVRQIEGTHTLNTLFLRTDSDNELMAYEFNDDGSRRAWSKWAVDADNVQIVGMLMDHPNLYIVVRDTVTKATNMLKCSIQTATVTNAPFNVHLDYRQAYTGITTSVDVTSNDSGIGADAVIVQGTGCPYEGDTVTYTYNAGVYTLDEDMEGGTVIIGRPYESIYVPQTVRIRDEGGYVQNKVRQRILSWLLSVTDTGYLTADIVCDSIDNYPNYPTQEYTGLITGLSGQTDLVVTEDGLFNVSFKQDPKLCDLRISSDHYTGATINQIEWLGNYTNRGRRF